MSEMADEKSLRRERSFSEKFAGSGPFGNCRKDLHRFPLSLEEAIVYGIDFLRLQCRYLLSVISRDFQNLTWTTRYFTTFGLVRHVQMFSFTKITGSMYESSYVSVNLSNPS